MTKREELTTALKTALKSKDQIAMSTIRLITAAIKDRDIAARGTGNAEGIGEAEILSLLQSMIKQRHESSKTYMDNARPELAERELAEIKIIETFLPVQMSDDEVSAAIDAAIKDVNAESIKDMGKVMAALKEKYAGQMDMAKAGGVVKTKLG